MQICRNKISFSTDTLNAAMFKKRESLLRVMCQISASRMIERSLHIVRSFR